MQSVGPPIRPNDLALASSAFGVRPRGGRVEEYGPGRKQVWQAFAAPSNFPTFRPLPRLPIPLWRPKWDARWDASSSTMPVRPRWRMSIRSTHPVLQQNLLVN